MKKLFTLIAVASFALSMSAQTVTESKTTDNWYVGINGGVAWKTTGASWLSNLNGNAGIRIGRYFTPVFGLGVEGNAYFSNKPAASTNKTVRYVNADLFATINLMNWICGYQGEPRTFEVSLLPGVGLGHLFNKGGSDFDDAYGIDYDYNEVISKLAIDFAVNLGSAKAFQVYLEPAITYALAGTGNPNTKYNINKSGLQLNLGIVYKFKNSNGTHNFTIAELRDQGEIDALNAKINALRGDLDGKDAQLAAKNKQIADLQKALDECNARPVYEKPETATNLQPTVLFRQGKSVIDPAQYAPIELIATYMKNNPDAKVEIKGYASPEGSLELNQKLSEERAEVVKNALVKKYGIDESRLSTQGCGPTDKLFEQVEFNRVATFNDSSK